ncbi:phthiocerol/phthiodiolone dimycocerosyl transferase family protein [Rhodococcoides yunnanense]|uniref:phthiocerol/phthiodiolone dimycocerosyl transferase family protein n=1 Tax=Rhodococcoides yunnanense TaxID=278209 RepID=UPI0009351BF8|nr:hypothetical protein [Rhodococcus yunnanensis]
MTSSVVGQALRPLGAFERTIDLYMHRNPVQFSLAIDLRCEPTEVELAEALRRLQLAHPLLATQIDRSGTEPTFRSSTEEIPMRSAHESTLEQEVAAEQTRPIPPSPGPLVRAVLITADSRPVSATVVLTFSHQIADGRGALRAVHDLVAILSGQDLAPRDVPTAQEDLVPRPTSDEPTSPPEPIDDELGPEQRAPATLRPFDGTAPMVALAELDEASTRSLRDAARAHFCTVQGVLCAVAAQSLFSAPERDTVRINVPIDLRGPVGLEDDVVVRFTATSVVLTSVPQVTFWELARSASSQLADATHIRSIGAAVHTLADHAPTDVDSAEQAMLAATNADIEITNLGVTEQQEWDDSVRAVWGPVMSTQVAGERILGVATHLGRLRLALTSHEHVDQLLSGIIDVLTTSAKSGGA